MALKKEYQEYITKKGKRVVCVYPFTLNQSVKVEDSEVIASPVKVETFTSVVI